MAPFRRRPLHSGVNDNHALATSGPRFPRSRFSSAREVRVMALNWWDPKLSTHLRKCFIKYTEAKPAPLAMTRGRR